ncbi:MAG: DNA polymerase III subunit alpha [Bacteroidaceae bacterium]|nr:DNA polymerase III subunit alpha [Bacteroidaceae bacterium]
MEDFVHLHVHTEYSILDGASKIQKLIDKAIANDMRGFAITDHGNMFGVKEYFDLCNEVNAKRKKDGLEPFKPIFGCEVYVAANKKEGRDKEKDRRRYHLILLAKNEQGYHNLIKIVSRAWVDGFYNKPRTDHDDLKTYHEGIICCSACIAGELPANILRDNIQAARDTIEWYKNVFGDDYYIELQRHEVKNPNQHANRETFMLQQRANKVMIELAHEYGVKLICSNDVHFVNEEDAEAHDHLLCLSTGKDLDDPNRLIYSKQEWFKTKEEMNEIFADVPEALSNTIEILDKCTTYNLDSDPIMPFYPIPEEFGTEEQWRQKFSEEDLYKEFTTDENGENQLPEKEGEAKIHKLGGYEKLYRIKFEADYLAKLAYEGAERIYGKPLSQEVDDRIRFELHIMKTMGFPGYFLIVQDFINSAREKLGVWVGPGRGSAAGSVVAYCLGITKIDPLKYDLLFERFLNPDRISLPDIDTDFDDDGRGKVLQWVMDKYGHENCAHIITYGTMATKNSIKDVARVEKLPLDRTNQLCKAIPDRLPEGTKMNLPNAIKYTPELQEAEYSTDPRESNTIKYAKTLEGTVRNVGIHACGFIICRDPISDHVPISTADDPDFPDIKTAVTQYDGHVIESTGLIKMDFLGLKTLSEQKEAVNNIKLTKGIDIDLDNIPIDDELTFQLYQRGQTVGTFQFESAGMQKYLRELQPTVFEDLIAMNALYRPGPMEKIPNFIARKHGKEEIKYDIPCMEKYLKDTYGITVYQEQVMLLSRQLANFTRGESDALRKAMGKKKKKIVDAMKPQFIEGGKKNGHDEATLEKIWGEWEKFASYAFNKSHAACYSWVAYQTAYLKAHYPAEFMAALLTRRRDDIKEITKLMDECKSMGIATLGPDVNESFVNFGVNQKGEIRFGLAAIKGVGESAAQAIIDERTKNGPFKDFFDVFERISSNSLNRKSMENLIWAGAFDSFNVPRELFFSPTANSEIFLDTLMRYGNKYQADKSEAQFGLFGAMEVETVRPSQPNDVEKMSDIERLNKERDLVGIYLSSHPLDEYSFIIEHVCNTSLDELDDLKSLQSKKEITFAGIVTEIKTGTSAKDGKPFGYVKLESFKSSHQFRLFGTKWTNIRHLFNENETIFVRAQVVQPWKSSAYLDLSITSVELLSEVKNQLLERITLTIALENLSVELVSELTDLANKYKGKTKLDFIINEPGERAVELHADRSIEVSSEFAHYINNHSDVIELQVN